jgi:hypothetical protein
LSSRSRRLIKRPALLHRQAGGSSALAFRKRNASTVLTCAWRTSPLRSAVLAVGGPLDQSSIPSLCPNIAAIIPGLERPARDGRAGSSSCSRSQVIFIATSCFRVFGSSFAVAKRIAAIFKGETGRFAFIFIGFDTVAFQSRNQPLCVDPVVTGSHCQPTDTPPFLAKPLSPVPGKRPPRTATMDSLQATTFANTFLVTRNGGGPVLRVVGPEETRKKRPHRVRRPGKGVLDTSRAASWEKRKK